MKTIRDLLSRDLSQPIEEVIKLDQQDKPTVYEEEPEDAILAASAVLQRLVAQARQAPSSLDWERDIEETHHD